MPPERSMSAWSMWLAPATMACTRVITLRPGRAPPTRPARLHLGVHQALQLEADGHGGDQQQPGVGHQVRVVEAHLDAVDGVRYSTH